MTTQPHPDPLNKKVEECLGLHKWWPWFLVLGTALVIVGIMAIGAALITTLATVVVFGCLLLAGGVVEVVNAFLAHCWRGFFLHLLVGVLHLVVGGLMIENPLRAAEALTLMLAVVFLVEGVYRVVVALTEQFAGWGWVALNGGISFLLGLAIWRHWPDAGLWVIGVFVGIDLIFNGWSWVMLGLTVKASGPGAPPAASEPQREAPAGVK